MWEQTTGIDLTFKNKATENFSSLYFSDTKKGISRINIRGKKWFK